MKGKKKFLLDSISEAISKGKNPTQISKELGFSKQKINYYIRQLKANGEIKRVGYGVWERSKNISKDANPKLVRGHAFIWRIKAPKINWLATLKNHNYTYKLIGIKETPRIIMDKRKIWLGKDIIIYDSNSFYGRNAFESQKEAVIVLLRILKHLENTFNLKLTPYTFQARRNHFALVKNEFAIDCNNKKVKIEVYDKNKRWLVVDDSLGEGGELENEDSVLTNKQMQDWWNDNKKNGFKVTPSFILESLGGLLQTQQMNADNIVKHQKVLDEMLITLKEIRIVLTKK